MRERVGWLRCIGASSGALSLVALFCASVGTAHAFVRTRPVGGRHAIRWPSPAVVRFSLDTHALPSGLARDVVLSALQRAANAWNQAGDKCSTARIVVVDGSASRTAGGHDGANSITFHRARWCSGGIQRLGACYDERVSAMTTLHFGASHEDATEALVTEADVELNAAHFAWQVDSQRQTSPLATVDLQTVVTHEFGHVLGLAHVCDNGPGTPWHRDHEGRPIPSCQRASGAVVDSVMVPAGDQRHDGRILPVKQRLGDDDVAGICAIYSAGESRWQPTASGCQCSIVPARRHAGMARLGALALAVAALGAWLSHRSVRRQRRRTWLGRFDPQRNCR